MRRYNNGLKRTRDPETNFRQKVRILPSGCWEWIGHVAPNGYGQFGAGSKVHLAHVWAYEYFVGPVPAGMEVDHACHNRDATCFGSWGCRHRRCVNPAHLEAATRAENTLRGRSPQLAAERCRARRGIATHCPSGHAYTSENSGYGRNGWRFCRSCKRQRDAADRAARKENGNGI